MAWPHRKSTINENLSTFKYCKDRDTSFYLRGPWETGRRTKRAKTLKEVWGYSRGKILYQAPQIGLKQR